MVVSDQHQVAAALTVEKRPNTNFTGSSVDPRAGLDGCEKSRLHRDPIHKPSSLQRVAIQTALSRPIET